MKKWVNIPLLVLFSIYALITFWTFEATEEHQQREYAQKVRALELLGEIADTNRLNQEELAKLRTMNSVLKEINQNLIEQLERTK